MKVSQLNTLLQGELLTPDFDRDIESGITCDLLSWVMAKGAANCAWVTVQTHMNVIAVAALHDMSCIVLPENITMDQIVLDKASSESIAVIKSGLPSYLICGLMYESGISAPQA